MGAVLIFAALTYGLVRAAAQKPARTLWLKRQRLAYLAGIPASKLTFDQAADGEVLAHKLGEPSLEVRFSRAARHKRRKP